MRANVDKNEVSSAIVENFNIEDYKKIEVSISEMKSKKIIKKNKIEKELC